MEERELEDRIVDAIRAKNAKNLLQQRERYILCAARQRKTFVRTFSGFAAAACVAFAVLHFNGVNTYKSFGDQYYSVIDMSVARGGGEVDSLLQAAYDQIGKAEYATAHENIDVAIALLNAEQFDLYTEEGQYFAEISRQTLDDAQWLRAVALMKQGKRHRAKILLREIAASTSRHAEQAKEILGLPLANQRH